MYDGDAEKILLVVFRKNKLEGTYTDARCITDGKDKYTCLFYADPVLQLCMEKLQTGGRTFLLKLGGMQREAHMSRGPLVAWEEAAKLKERVETALAKAIAASSRPYLDQADPLPVPTTGGSPEGGSPAPVSVKPGLAASQPLNQTLANPNGLANQNMVPQTNPNPVPQTNQNSVEVPKNLRKQGPSNAGEGSQGRHEGRHAPKRSSNSSYRPRRPGLAAAQQQSIEGQGLSMPIITIQNAISWSNREPQNKFTKNFQKRSKFSRQKSGKFRQISMSKNVIRTVLGRSRKKFSHKNKISNKIPKKLLKHDNPNKTDALVVSADH
jgi:hypothetical protein